METINIRLIFFQSFAKINRYPKSSPLKKVLKRCENQNRDFHIATDFLEICFYQNYLPSIILYV